ncbi:MAG: ABC transporter ATP-binding protein [Bryobacteraceae bacterium]|nr:ABC transporter ATP-binding protein [Bryobacteraceae bacterium]
MTDPSAASSKFFVPPPNILGVCHPGISLDTVIAVADLEKTYQPASGPVTVFRHLHLSVARGERVALVGASGAGKSTLLHLLGGLDRATAGRVMLDGVDLAQLPDAALADFRNRRIGFVWQIQSLLPEFTALENVMMPLLVRGVARAAALAPARERLHEVGLSGRESHLSGELSGGEQQRVALARALVGEPLFLLADEPTGNLDYQTADKIVELLERLHVQHRLTSVFVTHSRAFAARCDRVLQLEQGRLIEMPDRPNGESGTKVFPQTADTVPSPRE